jgi:hypothetical protein
LSQNQNNFDRRDDRRDERRDENRRDDRRRDYRDYDDRRDDRRDRDYDDRRRDDRRRDNRDYDDRRDDRRERDFYTRDDRDNRDRKGGAPAGTSVADLFKALSSAPTQPSFNLPTMPVTQMQSQQTTTHTHSLQQSLNSQPITNLDPKVQSQNVSASSGTSTIPGQELVASLLSKLQQQIQAAAPIGNKLHRELHISGIPLGMGVTPAQIKDYFNALMLQSGLVHTTGKDSIIVARISESGSFGFIECRTEQEATSIISLGSIPFYHGAVLKINRPKGYVPPQLALSVGSQDGKEVLASLGLSGQNLLVGGPKLGALGIGGAKQQEQNAIDAQFAMDAIEADAIFVSNLASGITSLQLRELFVSFGTLSIAYVFQKKASSNVLTSFSSSSTSSTSSSSTETNQGSHTISSSGETETGIIEFEDKSIIDKVIGSLNGLSVASVPMRLSRATVIQLREAKEEIAQSKTKSHVSPLPSNPLPQTQTQTQTDSDSYSRSNIFSYLEQHFPCTGTCWIRERCSRSY